MQEFSQVNTNINSSGEYVKSKKGKCQEVIVTKQMDRILSCLKKQFKTKFQKFGIASYDVSSIISLKRIGRHMRASIPYKHFRDLFERNLSDFTILDRLDEIMINGLVVELINEEVFKVKESAQVDPFDKYVFERIGSNLNISTIVLIKRCHKNTYMVSGQLEKLLADFNQLKEEHSWTPLQKLKADNSGNDKWVGHYGIDTTGGSQKGITEGAIQLANDIIDYCHEDLSKIVKYQLGFYLFHIENAEKCLTSEKKSHVEEYKLLFRAYCEEQQLDIHTKVVEYLDENGRLRCCISDKTINYTDIETGKVQLCHLEPVTTCKLQYDVKYGLISAHHYNNVALGLQTANMAQLNNSLEETIQFTFEMTINKLKKQLATASEEKKHHIEQAIYHLQFCI
jgi:hypothetical protein